LDFELADKTAPLITEEVTSALEDIVKQRILDGAWDDVERKAEKKLKPFEPKEDLETEKSALGLAEIYEKEYVEKASGVTQAETQLTAEHKEISNLFAQLMYQLDSLSNFNFAARPFIPEVEIRSNVSAIQMEEALPVAVSTSQVLAPEEVYATKQPAVGESELESAEKKSLRRSRKRKFAKSQLADELQKRAEVAGDPLAKKRREERQHVDPRNMTFGATGVRVVEASNSDKTQYGKSSAVFAKMMQLDSQNVQPVVYSEATATNKSKFGY